MRPGVTCIEADVNRLLNVFRYPEIRSEEIPRAGRENRDGDIETAERVDAMLHHSVATPDEQQRRTVFDGAPNRLARLAALRDFVPDRPGVTVVGESPPQLVKTAAERLAAVNDYAD